MRVARPVHPAYRLATAALGAVICAGSFVMWVGIPAGFIWISSRTATSLASALAIMLAACPLTMVVFAALLVRLNSLYMRTTHAHLEQRRAAWLRSLSGARSARQPRPLLEISMTVSASVAIVALLVWFFLFAHSSLPASPA